MADASPARAEDFPAALDVWRLANIARDKAPGDGRVDRVRAKLADPAALVVVARDGEGAIVGMALAEPGRDGSGEVPELCHVSMVFVHPDHWGKRIGHLLLDCVADQAAERGYSYVQLWTGQDNRRAQRLYQRAGYKPSGRIQRDGAGEAIIQLVRPLS